MTLSAGVIRRSFNMPWEAIGAIGAGVVGAFGSAHAAKKAYKYQVQLMNHQYDLTRQLNQNAYQDTTYSMRQAGINPMLAITQGANGLSAGSGGSVNVQNPAEAGNAAYALHKQVQNETKLRKSQESLNSSTESLQEKQSNNLEANTAYTQSQKKQFDKYGPLKAIAEIGQINAGSAKLLNDIKNSNLLTKSQTAVNSAMAKFTNERARGYGESFSGSGSLGGSIAGFGGNLSGSYSRSRNW